MLCLTFQWCYFWSYSISAVGSPSCHFNSVLNCVDVKSMLYYSNSCHVTLTSCDQPLYHRKSPWRHGRNVWYVSTLFLRDKFIFTLCWCCWFCHFCEFLGALLSENSPVVCHSAFKLWWLCTGDGVSLHLVGAVLHLHLSHLASVLSRASADRLCR